VGFDDFLSWAFVVGFQPNRPQHNPEEQDQQQNLFQLPLHVAKNTKLDNKA